MRALYMLPDQGQEGQVSGKQRRKQIPAGSKRLKKLQVEDQSLEDYVVAPYSR